MRDGLSEPSRSIRILLAIREESPNPQRVSVGEGGLEVALCGEGVDGCEVPTEGIVEIETRDGGEVLIDVQLTLTEDEVRLSPEWLSVRDTRDGGC